METPKAKAIMKERLEKDGRRLSRSKSYFHRIANNHFVLLEVCEALKSKGIDCYTPRGEYEQERMCYINGYKDGNRVQFGFAEVPYRWWINNSCFAHGNCRGIQGQHGYDYPFEIDDIIGGMKPCSEKELKDLESKKSSDLWILL